MADRVPLPLGVDGLGLIGSSVARAWLAAGGTVIGADPDPATRREAASLGVEVVADVTEIVDAGVGLLVLAAPTTRNGEALVQVSECDLPPVTMDVGSAKGPIVRIWRSRAAGVPFVATHPMAGSDGAGPGAGRSDLFRGAAWPVIVDAATDPAALVVVVEFIGRLGGEALPVSSSGHDLAVAAISHLPHLLAGALGDVVGASANRPLALRLAAGSFRDVSRVNRSPAPRTAEFIAANADAAADSAEAAAGSLARAAELLRAGEGGELADWLDVGHRIRLAFDRAATGQPRSLACTRPEDVRTELLRLVDTGAAVALSPTDALPESGAVPTAQPGRSWTLLLWEADGELWDESPEPA